MTNVLEELLGKTITVWSESNIKDEGKLLAFDDRWIKIEKPYGEVLYLVITNLRLLKPLR